MSINYAYCVGEHDQGRLRFINFTYIFSTAGRLEIYLNGHWGTICSSGFGAEDAILACNQLGYRTYRRYGTARQLGWVLACMFMHYNQCYYCADQNLM